MAGLHQLQQRLQRVIDWRPRRGTLPVGAWLPLPALCLALILMTANGPAAGRDVAPGASHAGSAAAAAGTPFAAAPVALSALTPQNEAPLLIHSYLEAAALPAAERRHDERAMAWSALRTFYSRRDDQLAWWESDGRPRPAVARLLAALDTLPGNGLDPSLYPSKTALQRRIDEISAPGAPAAQRAATLAALDTTLSLTFLTVAAHLSEGCVPAAERTREGWYAKPPKVDLAAALDSALGPQEDVAGALNGMTAHAPGYDSLRQVLARYRALAAHGGWPQIPDGPALHLGDRGPRVEALAARLAASGELSPASAAVAASPSTSTGTAPATASPVAAPGVAAAAPAGAASAAAAAPAAAAPAAAPRYDEALAAALARFQAAHGLKPKAPGLDTATLAELNLPVADRIRQIEINLERLRWTTDPGSRYILVNIPAYQLTVVENGVAALNMRVIVGKLHHETPVLADTLSDIVLNPPWRIPDSIAAKEVAPHLLDDPGYLERKGYEIRRRGQDAPLDAANLSDEDIRQLGKNGSPYRLRQPPGTANALGRYKFDLLNPFDIYMHDTPGSRALFARTERAMSHGCVRLEHPADLAVHLLQSDPRWTPEALAAAVATGRTTTIPLPHPIPVYILYQTAWVDADGTLQTRPDVYHQDEALATALAAEPPITADLAAFRPKAPAPAVAAAPAAEPAVLRAGRTMAPQPAVAH